MRLSLIQSPIVARGDTSGTEPILTGKEKGSGVFSHRTPTHRYSQLLLRLTPVSQFAQV